MSRCRFLILCLGAVAFGCSDPDEDSPFSKEDARAVAQRFHGALSKGDVPALVGLSRVPFRYKDAKRIWPDAPSLRANLTKEVPRITHLTAGLDVVEVFSRRDLLGGKWPRDRDVPEGRRVPEVDALGIESNGFLVRIGSEAKAGYFLVLNPEGLERLAVQGIDI